MASEIKGALIEFNADFISELIKIPSLSTASQPLLQMLNKAIEACNTIALVISINRNLDPKAAPTFLTILGDSTNIEKLIRAFPILPNSS